ncbi:hypothetical protein M885DRAFT_556208 [Pelagophyceae sp. CCMP2097]|nr:hypothetical protein M885DRAFT_556208 [Pelagophyceae sp. CCMP2097]
MFLQPPNPEDDGAETYGTACFDEDGTGSVFVEGDVFDLAFDVVERHPKTDPNPYGFCWPWDDGVVTGILDNGDVFSSLSVIASRKVDSAPLEDAAISVTVNDGISGGQAESANYDLAAKSFGYAHGVAVGDPNPFAPFTRVIFFEFERTVDQVELALTRHAIVLGVIQEAVPQIYMAATDPTLIFTVLRDPPGGDSFATITEGSAMSLNMEIAGMHAAAQDSEFSAGGSFGVSARVGQIVGFGVSVSNSILDMKAGVGYENSHTGPSVSAARSEDQARGHDLYFTFDLAISTSIDPYLAGQPSDVIVGGGLNLRVLKVTDF